MKQLSPFVLATLFFAGLLACTQQPAGQPADKPAAGRSLSAAQSDVLASEIDSASAVRAIFLWDSLRPSVQVALAKGGKPDDAAKVPLAFKVPIDDILLIAQNTPHNTDQLYAMLAIQPDTVRGVVTNQLTLIFRAPDSTGALRYYDFTEPCPPCVVPTLFK